jgi:hypothetical protein
MSEVTRYQFRLASGLLYDFVLLSDYDVKVAECDTLARLVDDLEMRLRQLYLEQQGCLRGR